MPFVEAKCTNCGAVLPVDSARDAWVCGYCGTPFVVEKAIQQFNITNNISTPMVNVYGEGTADALYEKALGWLKLDDKTKAIKALHEMTEKYPGDVRGWSQLARLTPHMHFFDNAIRLGDTSLQREKAAREAAALIECNEVRNGHGKKWASETRWYGEKYLGFILNQQYGDCSCVQQLIKEGEENVAFLCGLMDNVKNYYDRLQYGRTFPLDYIVLNNTAYMIIGNLIFYADSDGRKGIFIAAESLTRAFMQQAFNEMNNKRLNNLSPCCGARITTPLFSSDERCSRCKKEATSDTYNGIKIFWKDKSR